MCESEQTEVPKGAYYLTLHKARTKEIRLPSAAELAQLRLNEAIELERELDNLIQGVMNKRIGRSN